MTARMSMEEAVVLGRRIPPGTTVAADVWSVHYDPDVWGPDVEEFRPER